MSATTDVWLCSECDEAKFPRGSGEGYIAVYELRFRTQNTWPVGLERLIRLAGHEDEPAITVTIDGEVIPIDDIDELQAGHEGWLSLYDTGRDEKCSRCGDAVTGYLLRRGHVEVTFVQEPTP